MLKHPFRKLIGGLLPLCKNVSPNVISLLLLPVAIVTAWAYVWAVQYPALYLAGIVLLFLRMLVATLDGLVAITFQKTSPEGELYNRITPEVADLLLLGALFLSHPDEPVLGALMLLTSWGITFFGMVGLVAGRPSQSVGPVGQTDRLAALMVFSLLQYLSHKLGWGEDFMHWFFWWVIGGGMLTIALRVFRTFRVRP